MNYPIWDVPFLGAGLIVAIIAIIHVLISHLAIGGGAFLFIAELWSNKTEYGDRIREWLHKYATWFLVYTTVFGAVTGVGIWFSIQLASAEATSLLIHQFVFAWAIEWVAFLGELTVLYFYFYGWKKNSRSLQVLLAGAYFGIAWFSLFVINGILTFMLTPGDWTLVNQDIYLGFFNPGFLPSLFIRTLAMFLIGGLFGIIVATRVTDDSAFKERIISFSSKWVIPAALIAPFLMFWYWTTLPANTIEIFESGATGVLGGKLEALARYFWLAIVAAGLILIGTAFIMIRPRAASISGAIALFLIAQFGVLGAEFFREMARKPFVIYDVLYSNGLWKSDADNPEYMKRPYLDQALWHPKVDDLSAEHGEWVFRLQCVGCHTRHGYRSMETRTEQWTGDFGFRWLETMDQQGVMPKFQGSAEDRAALASYIMSLHGDSITASEILAASEADSEIETEPDTSSAASDTLEVSVLPEEGR